MVQQLALYLKMGSFKMNDEQLANELNTLLSQLNERQLEIDTIQEKFQVALTGVLRLVGESTSTLTNLHGTTEDLKGYLFQLNTEVVQTTSKSYQSIRNMVEELIELVSSSDRKS
jgi:archaellum component FlaC